MKKTFFIILSVFILIFSVNPSKAKTFKIASYNVENLFDLEVCGTEYPGYIPDAGSGWTKDIFDIKIKNTARVIKDLNADIIALQEIESQKALAALQKRLKKSGIYYPYFAIAGQKATAVRCALLSKFPIISKKEIRVSGRNIRNILKTTIDINGRRLIIYINHWKSKRGPESRRIMFAKALAREIKSLKPEADFILIGDFNSSYNEYKTFVNSEKLNNTDGVTGINHILKTVRVLKTTGNFEPVNEKFIKNRPGSSYLYNLWLEAQPKRRWSYNFFGKKSSPDNIIISGRLYDGAGISYVDNSFNKFAPDYLFKKNAVYRWQRTKKGRGKHLGRGYSDHLPVFAYFSTQTFCKETAGMAQGK